jgi:hypothetical protein
MRGYGDVLRPVIVIVSFIPLAGSPKFQKKYGELLVPSACKSNVRLLHISPLILIPVIWPFILSDTQSKKRMSKIRFILTFIFNNNAIKMFICIFQRIKIERLSI